jgi:hypothetical protein
VNVSPEWIQHMTEWAAGGFGRFFIRTPMTLTEQLAAGEPIPAHQIPFLRNVYGMNNEATDRSEYYRVRDLSERARREDPEERAASLRNPFYALADEPAAQSRALQTQVQAAERQLRRLRAQRWNIEDRAELRANRERELEIMRRVIRTFHDERRARPN